MSLGVNLLLKLVELAAGKLDASYDIEVFEAHHRNKKDAPSGTALALGAAAAAAAASDLLFEVSPRDVATFAGAAVAMIAVALAAAYGPAAAAARVEPLQALRNE